jgi:hypothetical protein
MKFQFLVAALCVAALSGCATEADVVSRNISLDAGEFKVPRRIVFLNGITDTYILTIEGLCQVEHADKLAVTCKTGESEYKKHYLGLSDNVTYFAEQLEPAGVSAYYYKVLFKPQHIVPDVELKAGK